MRRYLDTFSRFWVPALALLVIAPLISFYAVGAASQSSVSVTADIYTDQTMIANLGIGNRYVQPATSMTSYLTQLLATRSFDLRVARGSPLYWAAFQRRPNRDQAIVADLSSGVQLKALGPTIVSLSYAAWDQKAGVQLLSSLLAGATRATQDFVAFTQNVNQQRVSKTTAYYDGLLKTAQGKLANDSRALASYMSAHHIKARDVAQQSISNPHLAVLYDAVQTDQQNIASDQAQLRQLTISATNPSPKNSQAAPSAAGPAFRVIDSPFLSPVTKQSKKALLLKFALPGALGLVLAGGLIVLLAALDRSIRFPEEIPVLVGLPVLAVVPYRRRLAGRKGKAAAQKRSAGSQPRLADVERAG